MPPKVVYKPVNAMTRMDPRSEEHTSELQSLRHLVCRLLLEKTTYKCHISRDRSARAALPHPNTVRQTRMMRRGPKRSIHRPSRGEVIFIVTAATPKPVHFPSRLQPNS